MSLKETILYTLAKRWPSPVKNKESKLGHNLYSKKYGINYALQFIDREPSGTDHIIYFAEGSMKLVIPFASYVYLTGTEIDYSNDLLNGGFKFGNPQANRTCGCGTSFSV